MEDKRTTSPRRRPWSAILLTLLASLVAGPASAQSDFTEAFSVDPQSYLGLWYEVARTENSFEDNTPTDFFGVTYSQCLDSTAEYSLIAENIIGVKNSCTREAISDPSKSYREVVNGTGLVVPDSDFRKLKIAFGPLFLRLIQRAFTAGGADYWIYGLGEQNADGEYSWALVSGPSMSMVFVLSREETLTDAQWDEIYRIGDAEGLPMDALLFRENGFTQ